MKKFKIFIVFVGILIFIYLIFLIQIIANSTGYSPSEADVIVIFGYSLDNNENSTDWLIGRLNTVLRLYNSGVSDKIIVMSGESPVNSISVSMTMKKWLIDNGVPRDNIFFEDRTATTYENLVYTKNICDTNDFNSVVFVTNTFNNYRTKVMAQEFFKEVYVIESNTDFSFEKIKSYLKEPFNFFKYNFIYKNTSKEILKQNLITIRDKYNIGSISTIATDYKKKNAITNYEIQASFNPTTNIIEGSQKVSFKNIYKEPIDSITMNLYHNRFNKDYPTNYYTALNNDYGYIEIISVTSNQKDLTFEDYISHFVIDTPKVESNSSIDLTVNFRAYIPKISHTTGGNNDIIWATDFFPTVSNFSKGVFTPDVYFPFSEYASNYISNYNVSITTPINYSFIAMGEKNLSSSDAFSTTTYSSEMVRNFAFAIGKNIKSTTFKGSNDVNITFHHFNEYNNVYDILNISDTAMAYYNDNIGGYPYNTLDIIESSLHRTTAISNSGIIIIDSDNVGNPYIKSYLLDAVGRQWFGNVILSSPVYETWLTTGLPSFLVDKINNEPNEFYREKYNMLEDEMEKLNIVTIDNNISSYKFWNDYYKTQYTRTTLMLYNLSNMLGENKFNDFFKLYYKTYAFENVSFEEFASTNEIVYKKSLTDFFEQWLRSSELPEFKEPLLQ